MNIDRWSEKDVYLIKSVTSSDFNEVTRRMGISGAYGDSRFDKAYDTDFVIADSIEEAISTFTAYYEAVGADPARRPILLGAVLLGSSIERLTPAPQEEEAL